MTRLLSVVIAVVCATGGLRGGEVVEIDGLKSQTPDAWKKGTPATPMQYVTFSLPKVEGDPEDASLVVYFFGQGGGGTLDANIKRWKGQFKAPAGEKAKVEKIKVSGIDVTTVDVAGTFLWTARPGDSNVTEKPDFRMIGVFFDSKKGPYYFKFVGPAKTMEKHKAGFDDWLKNFK